MVDGISAAQLQQLALWKVPLTLDELPQGSTALPYSDLAIERDGSLYTLAQQAGQASLQVPDSLPQTQPLIEAMFGSTPFINPATGVPPKVAPSLQPTVPQSILAPSTLTNLSPLPTLQPSKKPLLIEPNRPSPNQTNLTTPTQPVSVNLPQLSSFPVVSRSQANSPASDSKIPLAHSPRLETTPPLVGSVLDSQQWARQLDGRVAPAMTSLPSGQNGVPSTPNSKPSFSAQGGGLQFSFRSSGGQQPASQQSGQPSARLSFPGNSPKRPLPDNQWLA